jgi:RimJ/RimL family protein N-acetyltransferase
VSVKNSDLDLALMQVEALYVHDAVGRLLRINEPDPDGPATRFFLARTAAGNIWRTRYDLPADLAAGLERLAADEPVVTDLQKPLRHLDEYTELLRQHAPLTDTDAGPAYYLPELGPSTGTVTITPENATLLQRYYPYTLSSLAERAPIVVLVGEGAAVAACYSARITAQVAEAGVHTVEAYRGRGYATEVVRGWAAEVRASRRLPLYSTSWENRASQAVAAKLGAVQYAVDLSLT